MQTTKSSSVLPPLKTKGVTTENNTTGNKGMKQQKATSKDPQRRPLNPVVVTRKLGSSNTTKARSQKPAQISVSGSHLVTGDGEDHATAAAETQTLVFRDQFKKSRQKTMDPGKMSLVCQLKMKSLRREMYLLKQSIPPTDDMVELLREKAAFDLVVVQKLKKAAITMRWDLILDYVQEHPQPGIFGLWEFVMKKRETPLPPRLQDTFNDLVNQHFDKDLQHLQLNKDRQNRVAKVMLNNMQKAEGYIDSLNLSIWEYQRYTDKLGSLVKTGDIQSGNSSGAQSPGQTEPLSRNIHIVYDKVKLYVTQLEEETERNDREMEALKIRLYESSTEIEHIENENKRISMDNKEKAKQIKALEQEKREIGQELEAAKRQLDDVTNDKQTVNRKLDEMMNVMVKGMETLRVDLRSDIQTKVGSVAKMMGDNMDQMETRVTARLDDVQSDMEVLQNASEDISDSMTAIERKLESAQKTRSKDKNVSLKIHIKGGGGPTQESDDTLIRTRSNKLRDIQKK